MNGSEIQVENGEFTRVHNAILEKLATARISSLEFRIVIFIIRKTYGFRKKTDTISLTQFETCGASRTAIVKAIANLLRLNAVKRTARGKSYEYGFNKYFETWLPEAFETRRPAQAANFGKKTTSKPDGTSKPDDTKTSKPDDTKTSKPDGTHKRKKESIKETSEHQNMFGALMQICKLDPKLKAGQIGKTAKALVAAGYVVADLETFERWWKTRDFRGVRGDAPTLTQVVDKILQAKQELGPPPPEMPRQYIPVTLPNGEIQFQEVVVT